MRLVVDLTSKCNLRCKHCGNIEKVNDSKDYNFLELLESFPFKIEEIDFMGGEPLLYEKLEPLIQLLEHEDISYSFITNGQFDIKKINFIIGNNLKNISVSVDGLEVENDYIRGKGTFSKSLKFIQELKILRSNYNFKIGVNFVVNKINISNINHIIKELLLFGVDYIHINQILSEGNALRNKELIITDEEFLNSLELLCSKYSNEINDQIITFDNSNPNLIEYLNIKYNLNLEKNYESCDACRNSLYIDNRGRIYPCRNIDADLKLDNLIEGLKEVTSFILSKEKDYKTDDYCLNCRFLNICYKCPILISSRSVICKEIDKRLIDYYDLFEYKTFKLNQSVMIIEQDGYLHITNLSKGESFRLLDEYSWILDKECCNYSLQQLSNKYDLNFYEFVDLLILLNKKEVVELYDF